MSAYGFNVLTGGQLDALDAIVDYSDKDIAYGVINGVHRVYQMNVVSGGIADNDVVVAPVGEPTARWHLMMPGGAMSHVEAVRDTGQDINDATYTTVLCDTELEDTLDEYDPTTGEFTAKHSGRYMVCASCWSVASTWSAQKIFMTLLYVNGTCYARGQRWVASYSVNTYASSLASRQIPMTAGDVLTFVVWHNRGATTALFDDRICNYLTIDRLV